MLHIYNVSLTNEKIFKNSKKGLAILKYIPQQSNFFPVKQFLKKVEFKISLNFSNNTEENVIEWCTYEI